MSEIDSPIFIIGTERSGTNLLRVMLDQHSSIQVPHPPHILKNFTPILNQYGDLKGDVAFKKLIGDILQSIRWHFYPWDLSMTVNEIFKQCKDRSLVEIFLTIYDRNFAGSEKNRWCCKSTFVIHHIEEVLRLRPQSKFVFMVRDVRDVVVSAQRSVFNHFHPYFIARLWQREQRTGLEALKKLGATTLHLLKYEDLLSQPEKTLKSLCAFLEEPFELEMLSYHNSKEASTSASLSRSWENTNKELLKNNSKKYLKDLTQAEIELVESIAYQEMLELNYELECDRLPQPPESADFMAQLHESFSGVWVPLTAIAQDRNGWLRLRQKLFLKYLKAVR